MMSNPKTLVKNSDRTFDELSAMGKKGGTASGKKRRELKRMRQVARALLEAPSYGYDDEFAERGLQAFGFESDEINQLTVLGYQILRSAKRGDMRAAEIMLKLAGEYPDPESSEDGQTGEN